jgi:hypothetical protein
MAQLDVSNSTGDTDMDLHKPRYNQNGVQMEEANHDPTRTVSDLAPKILMLISNRN